jgi:hypothetical protein
MAIITTAKNLIFKHKVSAVVGCVGIVLVAVIATALLKPGTSAAANEPSGIPTTWAQIQAVAKKNPRLAELGMIKLRQAQRLAALERLHPLTAAQRAAALKWAQQQEAAHQVSPNQKGLADASGFFPIGKSGSGPWPSCEFFGHNLYVSPPMGSSRVQYMERYSKVFHNRMIASGVSPR